MTETDASNGYEAIAREFVAGRGSERCGVGVSTIREWATTLPRGGSVLDLGCGTGVPIAQALVESRLTVFGVDASPTMVAAFRARFPGMQVECNAVERSDFFRREFDGVVAWGVVFLLPPAAQRQLIGKVAQALKHGGRFVFTAPQLTCEWPDLMTGRASLSLGADAYRRVIEANGMTVVRELDDEGDNHYYMALKPRRHTV